MKIYAISDTHLGHRKLEQFGRPQGFDSLIIKNLMKQSGDLLIHCGDFCIGDNEQNTVDFMEATRGFKKKILVRGNHDSQSDSWYLERGWDFVCHSFSSTYFGKNIIFTHIPIKKNGKFDVNVHGHMHGNAHRLTGEMAEIYDPKWHRDLAPEIHDYKAVNLEKIIL